VTALVDALQAALAGEDAAVWACGRAAGRLNGSQRTEALDELDLHRSNRNGLQSRIVNLGAQPVQAAPAYVAPFEVTGPATARRLLAQVNESLSSVYADVVAAGAPATRELDLTAGIDAARRAVGWGAQSSAFPGSS
jgi:Domain of unknown function (DUF4439)